MLWTIPLTIRRLRWWTRLALLPSQSRLTIQRRLL
jgi:hypothetical protein